ncbi:MAG: mechanosensitive ion channel family protein [Phycisphaeraceae bacterium]|nr:mechanosensitive ion channel family protein [Phycisphaeraceae bacterium]
MSIHELSMTSEPESSASVSPTPTEPALGAQAALGEPASILEAEFLGNPLLNWLVAIAILLLSLLVVRIVREVLAQRLERIAARTNLKWDDALVRVLKDIRLWLVFPALVFAASSLLLIPYSVHRVLHVLAMVGIAAQLILASRIVVDSILDVIVSRSRDNDGQPDPALAGSLSVLRVALLGLLIIIVVLLALDNLGVEITPMLTGLGIGGIAVALAVQNILGDLFSSLTILLDKPFTVGDFIIVGDKMGTVEKIGIKSTRVRALSGEQLIFSNGDLLSSRIQNFRRMQERRAIFNVGVVYETPPEKLRKVAGIIKEAIEHQKGDGEVPVVRFDRCHFKNFGDYSLNFEAVFYVHNRDMAVYLNIQQAINLELFERFRAEGISFAYPTAVEIQRFESEADREREMGKAGKPE